MSSIPPVNELRKRYKKTMENKDVTALSQWREPNYDVSCDEEEYLSRAEENAPKMVKKFEEVFKTI